MSPFRVVIVPAAAFLLLAIVCFLGYDSFLVGREGGGARNGRQREVGGDESAGAPPLSPRTLLFAASPPRLPSSSVKVAVPRLKIGSSSAAEDSKHQHQHQNSKRWLRQLDGYDGGRQYQGGNGGGGGGNGFSYQKNPEKGNIYCDDASFQQGGYDNANADIRDACRSWSDDYGPDHDETEEDHEDHDEDHIMDEVTRGDYDNNQVSMGFWVALRPNEPSRGRLLTYLVSRFLHETRPYDVYLRNQYLVSNHDTGSSNGGGRQRRTSTVRRRATPVVDEGSHKTNSTHWDLFYMHTAADMEKELARSWWWRYDLYYGCFWYPSGRPITDAELLKNFSSTMAVSFEDDVRSGDFEDWINKNNFFDGESGYRLPVVSFDPDLRDVYNRDPERGKDSGEDAPFLGNRGESDSKDESVKGGDESGPSLTTAPSKSGPQLGSYPVDPRGWNWQRYAGAGLFLGTFICTCALAQLAAYRQRRLQDRQLWGNIATEQGVDELLRTGWKIRGSQMEIYDKAAMGYGDDNSLFIGGFEQTEMVKEVGCEEGSRGGGVSKAEISVTQAESETTPDTQPRGRK